MAQQSRLYTGRARTLRKNGSDSEKWLWLQLRRSCIEGKRFRRQHPIGPYVVDFYCVAKKIAIELDGGQHARVDAAKYDAQRTSYLESKGIRVVRFWNSDIFRNKQSVLEQIYASLLGEKGAPCPLPILLKQNLPPPPSKARRERVKPQSMPLRIFPGQ